MRLYKFSLILLLIFVFSIGAVSSQDVNLTSDLAIDSADTVEIASGSENTFMDLNNDISKGDVINLTADYIYDVQTDKNYTNGVVINRNITINGNNHVVDASGHSRIFTINSGNVVINDLIIKNAYNSAILIKNASLITNNVTFENNIGDDEGGAIYALKTNYTSVNDKFINNVAKKFGSAIFVDKNSILTVRNDIFKSDNHLKWGLIEIRKSVMNISNTDFSNMTSEYSNAIHSENSEGIIKNCNFANLHADVTAGALGFKEFSKTIKIENCTFRNISSRKNAGALYFDVAGPNSMDNDGSLVVSNCQFINCSSNFGGALLQLSGKLNISNSIFKDNNAHYDGGAIYMSHVTADFDNLLFENNKLNQSNNSGAIFNDWGSLTISKSNFTNNYGAVYSYASNYTISNSQFKGNHINIYSFFDGKIAVLKDNAFVDGSNTINQINYKYTYELKVIPFDYNPIIFDLSLVNATYFDLRDYGLVTSVKDQGWMGSCWSFATAAALESALLKATNGTLDLDISENNLRNMALHYYQRGGSNEEGGSGDQGAVSFISFGAVSEDYDTYDEFGKISPAFEDMAKYYGYNAILIESRKNISDNYKIKEALVKYGALAVSLLAAEESDGDYNNETWAAFSNKSTVGDHAVTLVGWDDNYSANNFNITPPGNGAWIIKNSWGSNWGNGGYYYVSYYDNSAFIDDVPIVGFAINPPISYQKVYQYDVSGVLSFPRETIRPLNEDDLNLPKEKLTALVINLTVPSNFVNTFIADGNDIISAIGTYFDMPDKEYNITISVGGKEIYTQSGKSSYSGFEIIKLDKLISVNKGETFSVNVKAIMLPVVSSRNIIPANSSIKYVDGNIVDLTSEEVIAAIKVYTNPNTIVNGLERYYGDITPLTVNVNPGDDVTFIINGITATVRADENGDANLGINLNPGRYDLIISHNGTVGYYSVVIANTVISQDVTRGYNSDYSYKIKLINTEGVALSNVGVNVSVNNLEKEFTTDENGFIALDFAKLTADQEIEITNPQTGEMAKNTIRVVSRFSGNSNINMYYFDGTCYKFKVYGDDGKLVGANQIVTVKLNKKTYNLKTNSNGAVTLKIPSTVKPGTYTITATYKGQTVKNVVKIKQVLKTSKKTVKKSAKTLILKATLKNSKAIKGKQITFKFNGKTYKAKTNSKGIAKVTVKKNVIKKLKKGKTYTVKVTYLKDTIKTTVKVKG